jgi:hypothetical protein
VLAGQIFRQFVLDELVKSVDALSRTQVGFTGQALQKFHFLLHVSLLNELSVVGAPSCPCPFIMSPVLLPAGIPAR